MPEQRFILRAVAADATPFGDVKYKFTEAQDVSVVHCTPKMLLVSGQPEDVERAFFGIEGWVLCREQRFDVPDPSPRVRRKARI